MSGPDADVAPERSTAADPGRPGRPAAGGRLTRRRFLLGAAVAAGAAVALGDPVRRLWTPDDPAAPPPDAASPDPTGGPGRPLADVLAEAEATAGRRLLGSPWADLLGSGPAPWSAAYVSWLLRDSGMPPTADVAALYTALADRGAVGETPTPGALVFYAHGPVAPHHVGVVLSVTRGVAQTAEGDHPFSVPFAERFVRLFARPWGEHVRYAYPAYG